MSASAGGVRRHGFAFGLVAFAVLLPAGEAKSGGDARHCTKVEAAAPGEWRVRNDCPDRIYFKSCCMTKGSPVECRKDGRLYHRIDAVEKGEQRDIAGRCEPQSDIRWGVAFGF